MPKERKKVLCMDAQRHAEYYGMQRTFDELYAKSKAGETFTGLMELVLSPDNIMLAYHGWFGTLADCKKTDGKKNSYSGCLLCEQGQNNQCHKERFSLRLGFFYDCRHHGPLA